MNETDIECKVCSRVIDSLTETYFEVLLFISGELDSNTVIFCSTTCMDNYQCFLWGDPHIPKDD